MTPQGRIALLVLSGFTVAAFATAVVLGFALKSEQAQSAAATTTATTVPPATAAPTSPTTSTPPEEAEAPATTVIHLETPPPEIEGISEAVSRVLTNRGFAEMVGTEDPTGELADSIVSVLAERGVTLSVAEEVPVP